jgi:hypothetical protein
MLLTKAIEKQLPELYGTEEIKTADKVLVVKYFKNNFTWYAIEFDPIERIFYGYVEGMENEWGYFSLDELQSINVERDLYFDPIKFSELK